MKNLYILLVTLLFSQILCAQVNLNKITEQEFNEIKINNISFLSILNTHGNLFQLKSLLGTDFTYEEYDLPTFGKAIWNNNISMRFEDEDYTLSQLDIFESSTITIKGNTVKIGDSMNKLGNVALNTHEGDFSIIFIDEVTQTASFTLKVDPITYTIVAISYILF